MVTGAGGQLGHDLLRCLQGEPVAGLTRADLDLTDTDAIVRALDVFDPEVVVNAAAYTAVDAAESDEASARAGNTTAAANLARACADRGVRLVHVSTDYVFAGDARTPYEVDSPTGPRSVYGRTKLEGERLVVAAAPDAYVVRTAWVYGAAGANFVKTMVHLEAQRPTIAVVDDQRGSPTWSADLARGLVALARLGPTPGIYHCTGGGETTWYGLARAVFEELGADPDRVRPTTSDEFPRPAPRPTYSVLSNSVWEAAGLAPLPEWRSALRRAFAESGEALRGKGG
jgi:dTDP-4-dehydrorhamnose reductase